MRLSTTILIACLLAGILFIYFKVLPQDRTEQSVHDKPKAVTNELLNIDEQDRINWLQIQNTESRQVVTLVLENKQSNDWRIKFPVRDDANDEVVTTFIKTLKSGEREKHFYPEKDWEEYGLLRPKVKIGIQTVKDNTRRYLYLGNSSPVADMIFARWEGEGEYFLLHPSIKEIFDRSLYALREKQVFKIDFKNIQKILFRDAQTIYKISEQEGRWIWENPDIIEGKVMAFDEIHGLVQQLKNLYVKDFIDEKTEAEKVEFGREGNLIKVWDHRGQSASLELGDLFELRDAYYGRRGGDEAVLLVDRDNIRYLFQGMITLFDQEVVSEA